MDNSEDQPTERLERGWRGSAPIPRPQPVEEHTLDLPIAERPDARPVPYPPPAWGPQPGYGQRPPEYQPHGYGPPPPPQPRRRRRKWPWVLLTMLALTVACCCGCAGLIKPYFDQYPATVVQSATVPGFSADTDRTAADLADEVADQVGTGQWDELSFTLQRKDGKGQVALGGATKFVTDPDQALGDALNRVTGLLKLNGVADADPGPMGGHQRCGSGTALKKTVAVCGWADHGSIAVGVFTGRTPAEAADAMRTIRPVIIARG